MSQFVDPKHQFDGYAEHEDAEYVQMMDFIVNVESLQAEALGTWLAEKLAPKSVIDLGCGPGIYLLPYERAGAKIMGLDACSAAGKALKKDQFLRWDLRFPYAPEDMYDFCICTEVFEHMHEHWEHCLVQTIYSCSKTCFISWAVPGQGGSYHVNERPHSYVLNLFAEYGYRLHPLQDEVRAFLSQFAPERARGEFSGWLIDNSFMLTRD